MITHFSNASPEELSLPQATKTPQVAPTPVKEPEAEAVFNYVLDAQLVRSIAAAKRFGRKEAHDFNNILSVIHGFAGILQKRLQQDEANLWIAEQIEASALDALKLTNWLSTFANNRSAELVPLDLNSVVEGWVAGVWEEKPTSIDLEIDLAAEPLPMLGDEAQLREVCRELWSNALDSMPQGGRLHCQTTLAKLCSHSPPGPESQDTDHFLRLRFRDTGVGMAPETQELMFDPFFSTKTGKERGLGLSTVYDTVHIHQGFIQVSSKPGAGSCVDIYFPAQFSPSPDPGRSSPVESPASQDSSKVLVVDDEDMILNMVEQMLRDQGCEVVSVLSGEAALDVYRQCRNEISAVLLDMTLPGMGGLETFQKLKELDPGVKVIVSTGDPHQQAVRDAMSQGAFGVLSKPFLANHLTEVVKQALS